MDEWGGLNDGKTLAPRCTGVGLGWVWGHLEGIILESRIGGVGRVKSVSTRTHFLFRFRHSPIV